VPSTEQPSHPRFVLFTGPAGAGKSTLALAWCRTRARAVRIELDEVRDLIVAGRLDPQIPSEEQGEQYGAAVRASLALARQFLTDGYDVAITDAVDPAAYQRYWRPALGQVEPEIVVIRPDLPTTLARSAAREKRVLEAHSRGQHAAARAWPAARQVDTTSLSIHDSLGLIVRLLDGATTS
jgi:predicted kinase